MSVPGEARHATAGAPVVEAKDLKRIYEIRRGAMR